MFNRKNGSLIEVICLEFCEDLMENICVPFAHPCLTPTLSRLSHCLFLSHSQTWSLLRTWRKTPGPFPHPCLTLCSATWYLSGWVSCKWSWVRHSLESDIFVVTWHTSVSFLHMHTLNRKSSVQFKMIIQRFGNPTCSPPILSEVSAKLPLKQFKKCMKSPGFIV